MSTLPNFFEKFLRFRSWRMKYFRVCGGTIFFIIVVVQPLVAQNLTKASYSKAKSLLDESLKAYGGLENLRAVENILLNVDGIQYHRNQSRRPNENEATPRRYRVVLDLKNNRFNMVFDRGGIGRDLVSYRDIYDGKERYFINPFSGIKNLRPVVANWKDQFPALFLPQYLLLNANGRPAGLRYVGKTILNGRPHEIISVAGSDGTVSSLYIDAVTKLVGKQEVLGSDEFAGDALTETFFSAYRMVGKFAVPFSAVIKTAGVTTSELQYKEVEFDRKLTEADFQQEIEARTEPALGPPESKVSMLGENIYVVGGGGYRVLFVNFSDYIWVMEAPAGEASREVIKKIKETIPGKPIKYIAVTHFHSDHSSGVRSYVAEGVTVVTTKGNRNYFEELAKNTFTISPDALSMNPQLPKMEFVENKKRVFTDGKTTIELYDIGPSPHANELLVAYLPKEKILFEADVFDFPLDGRTESNIHFGKWIEEKGLNIEKIIPVHGTITTIEDFRAALAALKDRKK